jgi:PAS domain S-box-containing protein
MPHVGTVTKIVGNRVADVLSRVYDQVRPQLDKAFAGKRVSYELRVPAKSGASDGLDRVIAITYEPIESPDKSRHVIVVAVEITDVKLAEEKLRLAHERLSLAQEVAGMAIFDVDFATGKRTWSWRAFEIFGLSRGSPQPQAEDLLRMCHPDDRAMVASRLAHIPAGERIHLEYRIIRSDGEVRWVDSCGETMFDDSGRPVRHVGVGFDITDRKRAEEELRLSVERMKLAQDMAGMGIFDMEFPSGKQTWSPQMFALYGLAADSTERDFDQAMSMIHPDDQVLLEKQYEDLSAGKRVQIDYRLLWPKGEVRWIEASGTIIVDSAGRPTRYLGVAYDITARKLAEEMLRASKDRLRLLGARLESTIETERLRISRELHDQLGQALTGLKMDLDWIVRKHGASGGEWVPMVQASVQLATSTIALVRELSMGLRALLDTLGLGAAIESEAGRFQSRTGISCVVSVPRDKVGLLTRQAITVFRILQEALTNVARHAQAKHVFIDLVRERHDAILTVVDDGVGFDLARLEYIQSLGVLGMRERANLLDAEFRLMSAIGDGTKVTLRIPLHQSVMMGLEIHEDIAR